MTSLVLNCYDFSDSGLIFVLVECCLGRGLFWSCDVSWPLCFVMLNLSIVNYFIVVYDELSRVCIRARLSFVVISGLLRTVFG